MQEEIMSHTEKTPRNKVDFFRIKKRKLSLTAEENGITSKVLKKALIYNSPELKIPGVLHYRSTNDYTRIVAQPGSLPGPPKIFQSSKLNNEKSNSSDSFLSDLLLKNSFNTNVSERFTQMILKNEKIKKKKGKKIKAKKVKKEKTDEEKLERYLRNKEKKVNKMKRKKELKEAMEQSTDGSIRDDYELITNKVDIYQVPGKEILVFHMCHPCRFSFQGEYRITIVAGEVEVLGYSLSSSSTNDSVDMYSPNFYIPLVVETKPVKQIKPVTEILNKLKDNMAESDYNKCCKNFKPEDSILFVTQLKSRFGIVLNKYFDELLFPRDSEDVFLMTKTMKSLQSIFTFKFTKNTKHFRKNSEWDRIPLGRCTTLCGGKGVGKSTLLKYYVNKFVSLGEKVLCLDFDPGQPEFSFPGCLSAVVVDQPLVGPNFTHILEPILMVNYGDIEVSPNPSKYLECVKYIIEYCKKNEDFQKMKWFINTMGFCKGLGVNLMITILKLLKPDTVIQIKGSNHRNNYPLYLTPVILNSKSGFKSMPLDDVSLSHDLRVIYSFAEVKKKLLQGGLKNRQLRDIMAISYFSKMVSPPFYNFNAVQPYLISFSQLYLGVDFYIDPNDVLKAFNGNTVSLSHFEPDSEDIFSVESEVDVYFKVVIKPPVAPSLGIGFVRGIDCQEKKFYILTHLPLETLNQVNCLTLGCVSAPHSMFLKQDAVEGRMVYTTPGTADVIHRVKRMFRVPGTAECKDKSNTAT